MGSGTLLPVILLIVAMARTQAGHQKVLLRDLRVVTLHSGRITQGRRSSGVPQLRCVGGSAVKDESYWPDTVQCENKGFDGYEIQWECKADLSNDVRFGSIQMSCEGFDHPDDPYVLRGSCGLEYHLEFTREGQRKRGGGGSSWFGGGGVGGRGDGGEFFTKGGFSSSVETSLSPLFVLLGFAIIVYVLYSWCIAPSAYEGEETRMPGAPPPYEEHHRHSPYPPTGDGPPHGPRVYPDLSEARDNASPPPAGWNFGSGPRHRGSNIHGFDTHTADSGSRTFTTTEDRQQQQQHQQQQNQGFSWGSLFAGGLLGYLFGSGGNRNYGRGGYGWGNGWGNGWGDNYGTGWSNGWNNRRHGAGSWWSNGGGPGRGFGGGSGGGSSSSGSRTASGFGGTSRR